MKIFFISSLDPELVGVVNPVQWFLLQYNILRTTKEARKMLVIVQSHQQIETQSRFLLQKILISGNFEYFKLYCAVRDLNLSSFSGFLTQKPFTYG